LLLLACPATAHSREGELLVSSGPGRAGDLTWKSIELIYRADEDNREGNLNVVISGLRLQASSESSFTFSRLMISCPSQAEEASDSMVSGLAAAVMCRGGELTWETPGGSGGQAGLSLGQDAGDVSVDLTADAWKLSGRWSRQANRLEFLDLRLDDFDLSLIQALVPPAAGLDVLYGRLDAQVIWRPSDLSAQWELEDGGFDGRQGQIAGDALALSGSLSGRWGEAAQSLDLSLIQRGGELLIGSLYLPAPERPIEIDLALERRAQDRLRVERFRYESPGVARFTASADLQRGDRGWQALRGELSGLEVNLERAWPRWIEGPAASVGFADLAAGGQLRASARLTNGEVESLDVAISEFTLSDPRERFDLASTSADIHQSASSLEVAIDPSGLTFYGLPFGTSSIRLDQSDGDWVLRQPWRLPLLEGAVVIDRLTVDPAKEARGLVLDARIEPLSLEQLTRTLGWPEFGGQLSGQLPGIEFRDDRLDVTGGIDVNAFSGQIRLTDLVIERPLGSLPALATQVEIERLDLAELTGAFNFGRMEGQLSGHMRDLRLLDWRPVAMDTRLFTLEDAPRRRISQRAVDNLSNLGGGLGGALIGNTVLSLFEDFPYRRAGLACRLSNNICHIDGVAEHDSGGFYIVEGRGLPRLDIIGYRRLVDWPRLLSQLEAATE